ncbi:MAG: sirohydrochlorin chelatase [Coleofasciculus sp. S288]|nr:sirohydrochlorin chelatase [Coleofasciculus sp. S288]
MEKLAELVRDRLRTGLKQGTHALSVQTNRYWKPLEANRITASTWIRSSAEYPLVGTATLELAEEPLHQQIRQFASVALAAGCNHLQLLPLFLLPGVHVVEDIPQEVALAQQEVGQAVVINQRPHIGDHPGLSKLVATQVATVNADVKILLSHGSRRVGGNESVEAVAKQLGAMTAYWSVKPTLEEQIEGLVRAGYKQIAILPYFLFSGGITDAIAQMVTELQQQFATVELSLGEPIGATDQLADLLVELIAR